MGLANIFDMLCYYYINNYLNIVHYYCIFICVTNLFRISFILQIEDAMLMFDKQTNRHRGEFYFLFGLNTIV